VKPVPFEYIRPDTVEAACEALARDEDARVIAGGQTLIPMLAMRLAQPTLLVDIQRIADLIGIDDDDGALWIGAATRQADVEMSALAAVRAPLLSKALPWVGHRPIRTRGTIGGSIAHADPAAEIPLVALTLGAQLIIQDGPSETTLPASAFFLGPMLTALPAAAILKAVRFPPPPRGRIGTAFHEISARAGDFAFVAAAAQAALDSDRRCTSLAVGLGGVSDTPIRLDRPSQALLGTRLDDADIEAAIADAIGDLDTHADLHVTAEYRRRVGGVMARRVIQAARDEALAGTPR
jgi:CO/xanthine dehydrogenase FAD-binding subunit